MLFRSDGAPGLDAALAALWSDVAVQRCTVHKHRNLLAHAPERLHEEISNDYKDMIYAGTKQEIETKRKAFIRKWRLKCKAVADSLEEAGDKLFTFTRFPKSQWKSIRTMWMFRMPPCGGSLAFYRPTATKLHAIIVAGNRILRRRARQ